MIEQALTILDKVTRATNLREKREEQLLKDPSTECPEGWYMCVPPCFNEALDIKRTERVKNKEKSRIWTQGSWFSFNRGDTLYDSPAGYKIWSEALKNIKLCVQVKVASSAEPSDGASERFSGSVTFSILTGNKDRSKIVERAEHTMSRDDFVRFLIAGPVEGLKTEIERLRQRTLNDG